MISTLISWPSGFDFPLFRKNIEQLKSHVEEIIVCFTKHGNTDLSDWVMKHTSDVRFFKDTEVISSGDWRNKSTNLMIDRSVGDWILFLEQDFFIKDYAHFFAVISEAMKTHDVITFEENQRFHPAFLLVKDDVLQKTSREFSVLGQHKDHFWLFSKQLKGIAKHTTLDHIGLKEGKDWLHMRGLTDNYFAPKPYFDLPSFHVYNDACMKLDIPMSDYWRNEMERCSKTERIEIRTSNLAELI